MQMKEVTNKEELDFASQALFSKHPEMPCKLLLMKPVSDVGVVEDVDYPLIC